MSAQSELTAARLREVVDYDPTTGHFTHKRRPENNAKDRTWNTRYAGERAGYLHKPSGYWIISGMSTRTIERLIEGNKLPKPSSKYRREWTGPARLTALADALAKLPEPSARHASAIIAKIRGSVKIGHAADPVL